MVIDEMGGQVIQKSKLMQYLKSVSHGLDQRLNILDLEV